MAYEAGVIAQANPIGPKTTAGSLSARINAIMPTGWSFVENIPAGTGAGQTGSATVTCDVFKSAAANNDAGVDFYIGIAWNTSTPTTFTKFICAEDYLSIAANPADANRGKFRRHCPLPVTGTTPDATNFTFTETYTTVNALTVADFTPTLNSTGFSYWIKMTANFLLITTKNGSSVTTVYAGILDSIISNTTDTMPLVCVSTTSGSMSRLPGVASGAGGAGMWGAWPFVWMEAAGAASWTLTNVDLWANSRIPVSRVGVGHDVTVANAAVYGGIRGLLKSDVLCLGSTIGTAVAPGDTLTIGGNTWTVVSQSFSGASTTAPFIGAQPAFLLVRAT